MRMRSLIRLLTLPLVVLIVALVWYGVQLQHVSDQREEQQALQRERNARLTKEEAAKSEERAKALSLLAKCVFLIEQIKQDSEYADPEGEAKPETRALQYDPQKREQLLQQFEEELQLWCLDFKPEFKSKNLNNIGNLVAIHNDLQKKYAFTDNERIEASVKVREAVAEAAGVPLLPKDEQARRELLADARERLRPKITIWLSTTCANCGSARASVTSWIWRSRPRRRRSKAAERTKPCRCVNT